MISYAPHVPSSPDEHIKPYVDLINNSSLDAQCDFELTDPNECDVYSLLFQFHYYLSHDANQVRLSWIFLPKIEVGFNSMEWLDQDLAKFNENHLTKISYRYEVKKKFLFKKIYVPTLYHLELILPISSNNKIIADTVRTFYSDMLDFFNLKLVDGVIPKLNYDEDSGYSFIKYLQDNILLFESYETSV